MGSNYQRGSPVSDDGRGLKLSEVLSGLEAAHVRPLAMTGVDCNPGHAGLVHHHQVRPLAMTGVD